MRETYLDSLRALTRDQNPTPFVKTMVALQRWTAKLDFSQDPRDLIRSVRATNALERSQIDFKLLDPQPVSLQESTTASDRARIQRGG